MDAAVIETPAWHGLSHASAVAPDPGLRCIHLEERRFDRRHLLALSEGSRYRIELVEAASVFAAEAALDGADILLLGQVRPAALAADMAHAAHRAGVAVVALPGAEGPLPDTVTMLAGDTLTPVQFDRALSAALDTSPARTAEQNRAGAAALRELETLRRVTRRNMRLLKGEAALILDGALQAALTGTAVSDDPDRISTLNRRSRAVIGLIDDTTVATVGGLDDPPERVDLNRVLAAILQDDRSTLRAVRARIRWRDLPEITARPAQARLMLEELLLTILGGCTASLPGAVEIGALARDTGKTVIGVRLDDSAGQPRPVRPFAWSLCRRMVERAGGTFAPGKDGVSVEITFPDAAPGNASSEVGQFGLETLDAEDGQ